MGRFDPTPMGIEVVVMGGTGRRVDAEDGWVRFGGREGAKGTDGSVKDVGADEAS